MAGRKAVEHRVADFTFTNRSRYVHLSVVFAAEGHRWTAECQDLGTATFGATLEEAEDRIVEAIALHLTTLDEEGELERFCSEQGIRIYEVPARWAASGRGELVTAAR